MAADFELTSEIILDLELIRGQILSCRLMLQDNWPIGRNPASVGLEPTVRVTVLSDPDSIEILPEVD